MLQEKDIGPIRYYDSGFNSFVAINYNSSKVTKLDYDWKELQRYINVTYKQNSEDWNNLFPFNDTEYSSKPCTASDFGTTQKDIELF